MSEFKGTKGEWKFNSFPEESNGYISIYIPMGHITVYNGFYPLSFEENRDEVISIQEANARLISCAPEMLEMLIKLNGFCTMGKEARIELEQLIKKATEL